MCMGVPKFLVNKDSDLKLTFIEPQVSFNIPGIIKNAESLEGRKDICLISIAFNPEQVPMQFKVLINQFLTNNKKTLLELNKMALQQQMNQQNAMNAKNQPQQVI